MMGTVNTARKVLEYIWNHPANEGARLRAVGRAVSFQVRGRFGRPTLTPVGDSARMWVEVHCSAASKALYANPPDWAEMRAWESLIPPGGFFVDVGSNVGVYALWAAGVGARVIAVEPDARAAQRLRRNVALNEFPIDVVEAALAAESGTMRLSTGLDTLNHLVMDDAEHGSMVVVRTLDDLLGNRVAAGVKIDVEGAERLVLQGARRALTEGRIQAIQIEWNDQSVALLGEDRSPIAAILRSCGYTFWRPDGQGCLLPADPAGFGADVFALAAPAVRPERLATGR
jgi:FkbM family methyltransferase